jgi:hypothetical protein
MVTGSDVLWQSVTVFYGEKVRAKIIRELEEKYHELHEPVMEPNPPKSQQTANCWGPRPAIQHFFDGGTIGVLSSFFVVIFMRAFGKH